MSKIKTLFNNPKKAVIATFCAVAVVASLGTCTFFTAGAVANSSAIGEKNAQNFAFADAGVDPASAKLGKTDFAFKNGQFVYEVEFVVNGTEYDYRIKSTDGTVIKKKVEIKDHAVAKEETKSPTQEVEKKIVDKSVENIRTEKDVKPTVERKTEKSAPAKAQQPMKAQQPTKAREDKSSSVIGVDIAKKKALANAGVAESEARFIKQELENDDGVKVYDIEFVTADKKYEYEINARTGAILDKDVEKIQSRVTPTQSANVNKTEKSNSYIGIERAKSIAVARAGISLSDVTFTKAKLDREDGIVVYEVEFCKNRMEYECTINAVTGAIIEYEAEYDD